jgi:hypothetical protein
MLVELCPVVDDDHHAEARQVRRRKKGEEVALLARIAVKMKELFDRLVVARHSDSLQRPHDLAIDRDPCVRVIHSLEVAWPVGVTTVQRGERSMAKRYGRYQ